MKIKLKYVCLFMWVVCLMTVLHLNHIQEEQQQTQNEPIEKSCKTDTSFQRANYSKKNIINILILIISKTYNTYERS